MADTWQKAEPKSEKSFWYRDPRPGEINGLDPLTGKIIAHTDAEKERYDRYGVDPTSYDLRAALLDQKVAGTFAGHMYAYVPIMNAAGKWAVGIAVLNEPGYNPIDGWDPYDDRADAVIFCDGMNRHIRHTLDQAEHIICTTLRPPGTKRSA